MAPLEQRMAAAEKNLKALAHTVSEGKHFAGQGLGNLTELDDWRTNVVVMSKGLASELRGGVLHRACSFSMRSPSWLWVAKCGWKFGKSNAFQLLDEGSPECAGLIWCSRCKAAK